MRFHCVEENKLFLTSQMKPAARKYKIDTEQNILHTKSIRTSLSTYKADLHNSCASTICSPESYKSFGQLLFSLGNAL